LSMSSTLPRRDHWSVTGWGMMAILADDTAPWRKRLSELPFVGQDLSEKIVQGCSDIATIE
jgi:hypothetical protein